MAYQLSDAEKEWADSFLGKRIDVRPHINGTNRLKGTVIDYKADTPGVGVYFVCELDKPNKKGDLHEESYRMFPYRLNEKAANIRNMGHQLSKESRRIVQEGITRQQTRKLRVRDDDLAF